MLLQGHAGGVNWVIFSHDGAQLATATNSGVVRLWNTRELTPTFTRTLIGAHLMSPATSSLMRLVCRAPLGCDQLLIWASRHHPGIDSRGAGEASHLHPYQFRPFDSLVADTLHWLVRQPPISSLQDYSGRLWDTVAGQCTHMLAAFPGT